MRKNGRVDANHEQVVSALRAAGAVVQSLAAIGKGCPDLLVGYRQDMILVEVKDGQKPPSQQKLTDDQVKWHAAWRGGSLFIVRSAEEALEILKTLE